LRALAALVLWLAALPAAAEEVVAGLSQTRVAITTGFSGSEIFIYGAVKREAPPPRDRQLDVIVAVEGPSTPVVVRKKERRFGIWVNGPGIEVDAAPSFYAVATTRPFERAVSHVEDLRHRIGLDHAVRLIGPATAETYPEDYREAVIRLRKREGLYFEAPGGVALTDETLFRTRIALPAKLVEGDYRARIFLLRDREVIDIDEETIAVRKVGLERWIFSMAQERPLLYGLLSIAVALAAGWLASAFFRIFFP
jgi:uncharacterized protein (TIGR02186 family)